MKKFITFICADKSILYVNLEQIRRFCAEEMKILFWIGDDTDPYYIDTFESNPSKEELSDWLEMLILGQIEYSIIEMPRYVDDWIISFRKKNKKEAAFLRQPLPSVPPRA